MAQQTKSYFSKRVIFSSNASSLKACVEEGIEAGIDFYDANFQLADLGGANLRGAKFSCVNFCGANLRGADLCDLNLKNIKGISRLPVELQTCPPSGSFEAWKKGRLYQCTEVVGDQCIIKLKIPWFARRTATINSRKCRAELAFVLAIYDKDGKSVERCYNSIFQKRRILYKVGEFVHSRNYDASFTKECSNGIHFFMTKEEAER